MKVEIWSDVVCPWCYIGKRRFESALREFPHADDVDVTWRSFELDPNAPPVRDGRTVDNLARKYGMSVAEAQAAEDRVTKLAAQEGLDYRFDVAKSGNTRDAHRLLHLAAERGVQSAMKERLMSAYFTQGEPIGDRATLARLAGEVGIEAADAKTTLESDAYAEEVLADEREAQALGITGVPFFVIDRRYGVSGAQPAEIIRGALEQAWREAHPIELLTPAGGADASCEGDTCAI